MKPGGYVAVYRSLLEHPLMNQLPAAWFRIFMAVILKVNWKPGLWWDGTRNIEILPGQMVTSVDKLSKITRATAKQVRGCISYLQAANIAAIKTTSHYTVITVLNWDTYQNPDEAKGKPNGKLKGEPGANQGQTEGKARATIESGNQGNTESSKKTTEHVQHDELPASQKNAKPANSKVGALHPYSETEIQLLKVELAAITGMNVDLITDDAVAGPVAALRGASLKAFTTYLANLPSEYREGGIKHPWTFFASVASDYARRPVETEPTSDRCRHGKPYGCCCNSPALNDWYTAAFDPTSDDGPSERPAV
jgi:hypothetical protein